MPANASGDLCIRANLRYRLVGTSRGKARRCGCHRLPEPDWPSRDADARWILPTGLQSQALVCTRGELTSTLCSHPTFAAIGICRPVPKARARTRRMGGAWRRLYSLRTIRWRTRLTRDRPSSVCSSFWTNAVAS